MIKALNHFDCRSRNRYGQAGAMSMPTTTSCPEEEPVASRAPIAVAQHGGRAHVARVYDPPSAVELQKMAAEAAPDRETRSQQQWRPWGRRSAAAGSFDALLAGTATLVRSPAAKPAGLRAHDPAACASRAQVRLRQVVRTGAGGEQPPQLPPSRPGPADSCGGRGCAAAPVSPSPFCRRCPELSAAGEPERTRRPPSPPVRTPPAQGRVAFVAGGCAGSLVSPASAQWVRRARGAREGVPGGAGSSVLARPTLPRPRNLPVRNASPAAAAGIAGRDSARRARAAPRRLAGRLLRAVDIELTRLGPGGAGWSLRGRARVRSTEIFAPSEWRLCEEGTRRSRRPATASRSISRRCASDYRRTGFRIRDTGNTPRSRLARAWASPCVGCVTRSRALHPAPALAGSRRRHGARHGDLPSIAPMTAAWRSSRCCCRRAATPARRCRRLWNNLPLDAGASSFPTPCSTCRRWCRPTRPLPSAPARCRCRRVPRTCCGW